MRPGKMPRTRVALCATLPTSTRRYATQRCAHARPRTPAGPCAQLARTTASNPYKAGALHVRRVRAPSKNASHAHCAARDSPNAGRALCDAALCAREGEAPHTGAERPPWMAGGGCGSRDGTQRIARRLFPKRIFRGARTLLTCSAPALTDDGACIAQKMPPHRNLRKLRGCHRPPHKHRYNPHRYSQSSSGSAA